MERVYSTQLTSRDAGKEVRVAGWVHDIRVFGGLKFVILKDREGTIQLLFHKEKTPKDVFDAVDSFTKESVLDVVGKVQKSEKAKRGFEIVPTKVIVVSRAHAPVPLDTSGKIESGLDARLDYRFLDLRDAKRIALFKLRSKLLKYCCDYFDGAGFVHVNTPKLTAMGVESGAELFKVDYFGRDAFLSQSPQVYKQMMVCAGLEKVFEVGPVFRAEKSHTTRHLTEFTGIDFEMGFIKDEHDPMDVMENMFRHALQQLKDNDAALLEAWGRADVKVPKKIPRIPMAEAKKLLAAKGKKLTETDDLDPEAEKLIAQIASEKFGEEFVYVTEYPYEKRPFYHMKPEGKPHLTKSFDLIWNGLEVATGAQREHRFDVLRAQAREKGVDLDAMKGYADLFKYGAPTQGGAGMGLDRFMEALLKLDNIREGILLPRDPIRLEP